MAQTCHRGFRPLAAFALIFALLALVPATMFAQADKLDVFKYDFEDGSQQGWGLRGTMFLAVTPEAARSGKAGLAATGRGANWAGPSLSVGTILKKDAVYKLTAFARLSKPPASPSQIKFTMEEKAGGGTAWKTVASADAKDDTWVQLTGNYSFASSMDALSLYAESTSPSEEIYIDDIVIQMVTPPPAVSAISPPKDLKGVKESFYGYFAIGTAVDTNNIKGDMGAFITKQFNACVAENAMKPLYVHPAEDSYFFDDADAIVAFAKKSLMSIRYHTLVWHSQVPNWFFLDKDGKEMVDEKDAAKRAANKKLLLSRLESHVKTIVSRYKDDIRSWDVVNEVIDAKGPGGYRENKWFLIAGKDYVDVAFRAAREAGGPRIKLFMNDYGTDDPAKRDAMYKIVKDMLARGVPIDGIGHQSHISVTQPSIKSISDSIKLFGSLGLENQITELDISVYSDDLTAYAAVPQDLLVRQAYRVKDLVAELRALKKYISNVTFWGISDGNSWLQNRPIKRADAPLLFDANYQAKLAYWAIMDPAKLPPAPPAPQPKGPPKVGEAVFGAPKIDGVIDAAWAKAKVLPVDVLAAGNKAATAKARVMWDEKFVYVLMEVTDPLLNDASSAVHEKDSVEVFLDENGERTETYQGDDAQYRVNFKNEQSFGAQGEDKRFVSAAVVTKDGYLVEMAVPFRTMAGGKDKTLDFDLQINDADDSGKRVGISKWNDDTNESWRNTLNFGMLKLVK